MAKLFLVGFMAAGKSSVAEHLSRLLAIESVDLDDRIEASAGRSAAEIFAEDGEAAFRALERDALTEVISGPAAVVACGGGAPCHENGMARMRAAGFVVTLHAPLSVLRARAEAQAVERPLLSGDDEALEALYRQRLPVYRQAHAVVDVSTSDAAAVAAEIARLHDRSQRLPAQHQPNSVWVALRDRAYPVVVSRGLLDSSGALLAALLPEVSSTVVVSDSNVGPLYAAKLAGELSSAGVSAAEEEVPAGEASKNLRQFEELCDRLVAAGLDRSSAVVALGGGVIGDLAGYAAASLYRGVRCVQFPTTVVAMVDSAIGGKTGVNLAAGKNLVGAFWQPAAVLADPDVLVTLPARERRAAFGEILKYALLDGEDLYKLADAVAPALAGDDEPWTEQPEELDEVIRRSAAIKAWIVSLDETESGDRALLNLGHTVGHAIEAEAGYGTLLHGEAVALGLIAACRLSHRLGLCAETLEERVTESLTRAGLDTDLDRWLTPQVLRHVGVDKKRTGKQLRFITVADVGRPALTLIDIGKVQTLLRR